MEKLFKLLVILFLAWLSYKLLKVGIEVCFILFEIVFGLVIYKILRLP